MDLARVNDAITLNIAAEHLVDDHLSTQGTSSCQAAWVAAEDALRGTVTLQYLLRGAADLQDLSVPFQALLAEVHRMETYAGVASSPEAL